MDEWWPDINAELAVHIMGPEVTGDEDYKVRIVNSKAGTAAKVRVVIEFRDKNHFWATVGVSTNIIEASWKALVDAYEYKLLKDKRG